MKKTLLTLALAVGILAPGAYADKYKLTVPVQPDRQGKTLYLLDYDKGVKLDSLVANGESVQFVGEIAEPVVGVLQYQGDRRPFARFVLEDGAMVYRPESRDVVGTMLNDKSKEYDAKEAQFSKDFQAAASEEAKLAVYNAAITMYREAAVENADNPLGLLYFMEAQQMMPPQDISDMITANPGLAKNKRVQAVKSSIDKKLATSVGKKFVDFEINYDGKTERLSDYVGKGKYVLVDFWASWCGPCIRQTVVLKDLYNKYKDKGLEVLGVAVWDDPEDTKEAIKDHNLPWHSILNGGNIPTDLYGITGIPTIILFGPDGTILSRDKQDDELKADVAKYFE